MVKKIVKLDEPKVPKILPPQKEEICRVGIVLEEDNKTEMTVILPPGIYEVSGDYGVQVLNTSSKRKIIFKADGDFVLCSSDKNIEIAKSKKFVKINKTGQDFDITPKSGFLIKDIVAGRGFHWQKEVDLTFPGKLEFHIKNKKLIVVNEIRLEDYLACVVTSEMSPNCPPEFIKAQVTAARSWMVVFLKEKHKKLPYTICNDDCCQRYQGTSHLKGKIADIVAQSRGVYIITKEGYVCASYYSKSCGGIIEKVENIFGKECVGFSESIDAPENSETIKQTPVTEENIREWIMGKWVKKSDSFCSANVCREDKLKKYLGAVDDKGKYYRWCVKYSNKEIVEILKEKIKTEDIKEFVDFMADFRGNSGRIHKLTIIYKDKEGKQKSFKIGSQYEIRYALHKKFLFSSSFIWDYEKDSKGKIKNIILNGSGWGHGAGFCQIGALGMSLKGYTYEEILKHYFDKTSLKKMY